MPREGPAYIYLRGQNKSSTSTTHVECGKWYNNNQYDYWQLKSLQRKKVKNKNR